MSSRKLRNGKMNPKNYPYCGELIRLLHNEGIHTIQVRTEENEILPTREIKTDLPLNELADLIRKCDAFVTVDNFFQHYATYLGKRGVVIFSRSDPMLFGYPENINLLKHRKYLRENQFDIWEADEFIQDAFVFPNVIVRKLKSLLFPRISL